MQIPISENTRVPWLSFEDQRGFVTPRTFQMPIQAVGGDIKLSPDKPLGMGRFPFTDCLPWLCPVQKRLGLFGPPPLWVSSGLVVNVCIADICLCYEFG